MLNLRKDVVSTKKKYNTVLCIKVWISELLMVTRCPPNWEHDNLAECQGSLSLLQL